MSLSTDPFSASLISTGTLDKVSGDFPSPFLDYASTYMPDDIYEILKYCEHLWLINGTYRMAAERVVRYFLTAFDLSDITDEERQKYLDYFNGPLNLMNVLSAIGDDFMCYGNSFISVYIPFRRYLRCPECKTEVPIDKIDYKFKDFEFYCSCKSTKCSFSGKFEHVDRKTNEPDKLKIVRYSPHDIEIIHNPISQNSEIIWKIPGDVKSKIKKGILFYIKDCPWEIIECVKLNKDFKFYEDFIFHIKDPGITGVKTMGWGIPRLFSNFKQAYYIQILKRFNEALALDYIVPFRVVTPAAGNSQVGDPLLNMGVGDFSSQFNRIIKEHRRDPCTWHTVPFPISYTPLGGEGVALAPKDLLDQGMDELLNAAGMPAELYRGTLTVQAMPTALRLFQQTWVPLTHQLNSFLDWLMLQISKIFQWDPAVCKLQPVTLADDLEKRQIMLQLASAKQVSMDTALRPFEINFREEIKRMLQEQKIQTEEQAKFEEEMSQQQALNDQMQGVQTGGDPSMQGGMPMGGMPAGGSNPNSTPQDIMAQAQQIAMQLLSAPYATRRQQLSSIKNADPLLHSAVTKYMEQVRQDAGSQGQQAVMQEQFGAGAVS